MVFYCLLVLNTLENNEISLPILDFWLVNCQTNVAVNNNSKEFLIKHSMKLDKEWRQP